MSNPAEKLKVPCYICGKPMPHSHSVQQIEVAKALNGIHPDGSSFGMRLITDMIYERDRRLEQRHR